MLKIIRYKFRIAYKRYNKFLNNNMIIVLIQDFKRSRKLIITLVM